MTEKDFRRLVTDLEVNSVEKEKLLNIKSKIEDIINNESLFPNKIIEVKKGGSWANGTLLSDSDEIDLVVIVEPSNIKPIVLVNESVLNSVINALIYNLSEVVKLSDISRLSNNTISVILNDIKVNILIRYNNEFYDYKTEEMKVKFIEIANKHYTYYRNAIKIIEYYKDINNININSYILEILLYYSLNEYFKDNRYEDYLNGFVRAIDDFLKGKIIEVSKDIYDSLEIVPINQIKKGFMVIDLTNPMNNLTSNISEIQLSEYRKLRKALSKLIDTKQSISSNAAITLNINPVAIKGTNEFKWSYLIENSDIQNSGGSYQNVQEQLQTAYYKALYKGLRAIVDNGLNRNNVEIVSNEKNLLKITEFTSSDNRSRIKNIEAFIENNNMMIRFK